MTQSTLKHTSAGVRAKAFGRAARRERMCAIARCTRCASMPNSTPFCVGQTLGARKASAFVPSTVYARPCWQCRKKGALCPHAVLCTRLLRDLARRGLPAHARMGKRRFRTPLRGDGRSKSSASVGKPRQALVRDWGLGHSAATPQTALALLRAARCLRAVASCTVRPPSEQQASLPQEEPPSRTS